MFPFWLPFVAAGLAVDCIFIRQEYAGGKVAAVIWKGLASLIFVALGLACYFSAAAAHYGRLIVIGLILGMIGDVLLNLRNCYEGGVSKKIFAGGIVAFLGGHFLYIAALIGAEPALLKWAAVITAALGLLLIPALIRNIDAPSKGLKNFGIVYLIIVTAMFACSAALLILRPHSVMALIFAVGALLFLVSDFIMIYYFFGRKKIRCLRAINLLCYYIGQLLIALTIILK